MIFSFRIPCSECNGQGEFVPFNPSEPITKCDCDNGGIWTQDFADSKEMLLEDYPDAYEIQEETVGSIYAKAIQSIVKGDYEQSAEYDRILARSFMFTPSRP